MTHQFSIESVNAPTVLPRIALIFTRRGIGIEHLEMATEADRARFGLSASCTSDEAAKLGAQLRRIVEVVDVNVAAHEALASAASA